mmetsp:Transcript_35237/g.80441  ORF Transcript_35237/g.80441 Transcript_35237/m.80441 type:complete len:261 (-) Transcript_35237:4579-5361(-)
MVLRGRLREREAGVHGWWAVVLAHVARARLVERGIVVGARKFACQEVVEVLGASAGERAHLDFAGVRHIVRRVHERSRHRPVKVVHAQSAAVIQLRPVGLYAVGAVGAHEASLAPGRAARHGAAAGHLAGLLEDGVGRVVVGELVRRHVRVGGQGLREADHGRRGRHHGGVRGIRHRGRNRNGRRALPVLLVHVSGTRPAARHSSNLLPLEHFHLVTSVFALPGGQGHVTCHKRSDDFKLVVALLDISARHHGWVSNQPD